MDLKFKEKLAYYILGQETSAIQSIAIQGMEEGFDTPSLIILAGLQDNETSFEVTHYFNQAVRELNLDLQTGLDAALYLTNCVAEHIVNGTVDPYEGCKFIFENVLGVTNLREKDKHYAYDGISLAKVHGLYDMVCDLEYAAYQADPEKNNDQVIQEMKTNIKLELLVWLKNNGS